MLRHGRSGIMSPTRLKTAVQTRAGALRNGSRTA
jgi:hypothetical protein